MRKRLKTTAGAAAALLALALGGSAIASATQSTPSKATKRVVKHAVPKKPAEKVAGVDRDNIQSGDLSSPDHAGARSSSASTSEGPGTETSSETSSESTSVSDGPGGHEDPEGNVENQSETQE